MGIHLFGLRRLARMKTHTLIFLFTLTLLSFSIIGVLSGDPTEANEAIDILKKTEVEFQDVVLIDGQPYERVDQEVADKNDDGTRRTDYPNNMKLEKLCMH